MDITDDMIVTFDAAYMVCAETHVGGDGDTSERCCIAAGIERVAPLIAAQALRSAADLVDRGPTFPLPPSVISALLRERADDLAAP